MIAMPSPTIEPDENLLVVSFDGSARVKHSGGAYSAVVWKLPEWTVAEAMSVYMLDLTVNEAEYRGLILGFDLLSTLDRGRVVICGDSNLVIRQMQGEMECKSLNRLGEILKPKLIETVVSVNAITRAAERQRRTPKAMEESIIQRIRCQRIRQAQDEEKWIADLKKYLDGEVNGLTAEEANACSKIDANYEVDKNGLLFFCPKTRQRGEDRDGVVRIVISDSLQRDFLHHYHASLEGGHQGVGRTYRRTQANFHWRESPGNIQGTYPFQVISMDHIPSLPKSFKGKTELLIWADLFTGYVIAKAGPSREAQAVAENYEECAFRRFGASEVIRHDRDPGFMSDFFRAFNRIVKMRQSATMAYHVNQQDWDDYAERLTFALNTPHDRVRGETSFFLVHGWDPRSTLETVVSVGSTRRRDCDAWRWRYHIQGQYRRASETVNETLRDAIKSRADQRNGNVRPHRIEEGTQVWLYLDRVKEGYARKLVDKWHGPFRVTELIGNHAARLETAGSVYRIFPIVHLSKLKPVQPFPDRPKVVLNIEDDDRVDFDEELLPDDSWDTPLDEDEFEVERIADVRSGTRTRYGRVHREFQVYWKGYDQPIWVDQADLNCAALLYEYEGGRTSRNRFNVMQSHEEGMNVE
ncbi:reverse transcriptase [Phytophthora megakarya]|uniref:Reverse transcriptase n=1 Tax=Phytophthora megakarya TaxID=4795 RepID=A0A225W141_9STRA|nr:reverse transcriptase [Phytophthora megakarya]